MRRSAFARALAVVAWREDFREGAFVHNRRGTGEKGWWHDHGGPEATGEHPMDYDRETKTYKCRECGETLPADEQAKAK